MTCHFDPPASPAELSSRHPWPALLRSSAPRRWSRTASTAARIAERIAGRTEATAAAPRAEPHARRHRDTVSEAVPPGVTASTVFGGGLRSTVTA